MTNLEIVDRCMRDRDPDLSRYDDVLTVDVRGTRIPLWRFMEGFEWVVDQDTNTLVPFRLRWAQKVLYSILCEQKMNGMPMRADILKARQLGLSTFISGMYLPLTLFTPNAKACIMADLDDHTKNLFGIYDTYYRHLSDSLPAKDEIARDSLKGIRNPNDIRPTLSHMREGEMMKTEIGDSTIECVTAGESAGRSAHYRYIHDSETAFQKNLEKTCVSLFSTVSVNDPESIIVIETTANGYNDYKARWDNDASGNTAFAPVFFPWYRHPGYTRKAPVRPPEYPLWFYDKWRQHPEVTQDQMFWYWTRYSDYNGNEALMKQEFPWDPEDAFISTGLSVFDPALVKKRMDEVRMTVPKRIVFGYSKEWSEDGQTIRVSDVHETEMASERSWKVYEEPKQGRHYVAICDPTKGDNSDFSAIQVLDQNTGTQMAVYNAKERIEDVAFQLYCAAVHWNWALVSSENNTGPAILELLTKMQYPKIYVSQASVYDNFQLSYTSRLGHSTNTATRDAMIQDFVMAFRDNPDIVRDYDTLSQMQTFQYVKAANSDRMKAQASSRKYHDDEVMAYVPFWKVRIQQDFDRKAEQGKAPEGKLSDDEIQRRIHAELSNRRREERRKDRVRNVTGITW